METPRNTELETRPVSLKIAPPELLISVATGSLLTGLVVAHALTELLQEVGKLSEEIFRGDRLPLLNVPITSPSSTDTPNID